MHVIARFNVGGTASYLCNLLLNQQSPNFEHILVIGSVQGGEVEDNRVSQFPLLRIGELGRKIHLFRDFKARRRLKSIIEAVKPDVIISHTFKAGLLVRSLPKRTPVIHTFHGHLLSDPEFAGLAIKLIVLLERLLARRADILIATGINVYRELNSVGIKHSHWNVLYPGIVPPITLTQDEAFSNLGIRRIFGNKLVIGWHSRFAAVKNVQLIFDIAQHMPKHQFLISGNGELFEYFLKSCPQNVQMLGWQATENVLGAADIVVSTSFNEGMPLTLIEASMLGKPCIATKVGSVGEIVVDGKTGFLVDTNRESFISKIEYLESNRNVLTELSKQAKSYSRSKFKRDFFIKKYQDLVLGILN